MKQRNYAIDLIKFIAVIFITNSHFIPLYEDINKSFATLGVHGNALFFFASGYTLTLGKSMSLQFKNWYKRRIQRIWPTIIIWTILSNLIFNTEITWENILLAKGYWFIQCIMISYIFLYYIQRYQKKYISTYLILSILLTSLFLVIMNKVQSSIYHSSLHFICYFPSMMLGLYIGNHNKPRCKYGLIKTILYFLLYFIIMKVGKGKTDILYYTQIIAIIPLNLFIYYLYVWLSSLNIHKFAETNKLWKPIYWISSMYLEIYVVQFSVITDRFNDIFPLSIFIVFMLISFTAYCLRIFTNIFNQTFSCDSYSLKHIVKI